MSMEFVKNYLKRQIEKNRLQAISEALLLLEREEREAALEAACSMSAASDRLIAAEFFDSDNDGLGNLA